MTTEDIVNWNHIKESLELALEEEAPEAKEEVITTVEESLANNDDLLEFENKIEEESV